MDIKPKETIYHLFSNIPALTDKKEIKTPKSSRYKC